jgi:hypothetical protein
MRIRIKKDDLGRASVTVDDVLVAQLDRGGTEEAQIIGGISGWWKAHNEWKLEHPDEDVIKLISPHGSFSFTILMYADGRLVLVDQDGREHPNESSSLNP